MQSVLPYCREKDCTYIVLYSNVELNETMYKYGYYLIEQTYSYDVYKYVE
jgi:hypothetical protein